MNRPTKIALGVVTAIAIFAVGVQYSENVIRIVHQARKKLGIGKDEDEGCKKCDSGCEEVKK